MKAILFFIALLIALSSCNYKLFVHKNNIYHKRTGYLVFFYSNMIFYPAKYITGNDFFTTRINGKGLSTLNGMRKKTLRES